MAFKLPALPYKLDALEPHMSRETLQYHYGKHHKTYVDKTNKLVAGSKFEKSSLEDIVRKSSGAMFNNASQTWNHSFFWNCLTPERTRPGKKLEAALNQAFDSLDNFRRRFTQAATGVFGSGWAWLVMSVDGALVIATTPNAGNPMTQGHIPLLTCDVWEHAYYIDYLNARPEYLKHYWSLVNWTFVGKNFDVACKQLARVEESVAGR